MKKRYSFTITLLIALMVIISVFAACAGVEETSSNSSGETFSSSSQQTSSSSEESSIIDSSSLDETTSSQESSSLQESSSSENSSSSVEEIKSYTVTLTFYNDWEQVGNLDARYKINFKWQNEQGSNTTGLVSSLTTTLVSGTVISLQEIIYDSDKYALVYYTMGNNTQRTQTGEEFTIASKNVAINVYFVSRLYNISYTLNLGTLAQDSPVQYKAGVGVALKTPTRENYTFKGWFINGTGNAITSISPDMVGDLNLHALWTSNAKTLTINVNNSQWGQVSQTSISVDVGASISIGGNVITVGGQTITATAKDNATGYKTEFVNWTGDISYTTMPEKDITITANFNRYATEKTLTISVNNASLGEVSKTSINVAFGTAISISGNVITVGGQTITATAKDNATGYKTEFVNWTGDTGYSTMPNSNITIVANFTRNAIPYKITTSTSGTGTLNINKTTANYQDSITLGCSAGAGYVFSHYVVDGATVTQKDYTFSMPAKAISVKVVFVAGIGELEDANFSGVLEGSGTTGSVNYSGNSIESTKSGAPFVFTKANGDFYYETKIATNGKNIFNNDSTPKFGIAVNVGRDNIFFYVDAMANGYNNNGYGTNTWSFVVNGYGEDVPNSAWYWGNKTTNNDISGKNFGLNYGSFDTYVKMAIMRVGGVYSFFINENYSHSLYYPNMTDCARIGVLAFNIEYKVKESKISKNTLALNNAKYYYRITNNLNPTEVTMDGFANDWKENAISSYGVANGDKYFYASAFVSGNYVYAIMQARSSNYITTNANWWDNTNAEFRCAAGGENQMFVSADGQNNKVSAFNHIVEYEGDYKRITFEVRFDKSLWGSNPVKLGFAFKSGLDPEGKDSMPLMNYIEPLSDWWCGMTPIDQQQLEVSNTGLVYSNGAAPTDPIIKTGVAFADPFVMEYNGTYYMYGTGNVVDYRVSTSTDLVHWSTPTVCFSQSTANSFATTELWAPEVKYNSSTKKFVMMYSGSYSGEDKDSFEKPWCPKVGVAISDSPMGPFVDVYGKPLLYPNDEKSTIDGSIFVDDNGQAYLYYCLDSHTNWSQDYVNDVNNGHLSEIWVVQLDSTWTKIVGEHTRLIRPEQPWEMVTTPYTTEGPFVYKAYGKYYLTYSSNVAWDSQYGVGLAISNSPTGPFVKQKDPIVYQDYGQTKGTGHSMMFTDKDGNLWCAFHTITDVNWVQTPSNFWPPRSTLLARAYFKDQIMKVAYKNPIVTP